MDILRDRVKPMYFQYLAAASGSALVASIFGMVDAMMVGQYHGPAGNAALAVFNPLWSMIYCLGLLAGIGGSVLFANLRGKGEEDQAQEYFTLSIYYGLALTACVMLGIGVFREPLFRFFGADEELLELASQYLTPIFYAIPCCVFSNIISAFLRNDGNPDLATKAVVFGGILNAVADYVCVFVWDLGIFGAGLATALGQYVAMAVMLTHFISKKNTLRLVKIHCLVEKIRLISWNGFSTAISDLALGTVGILFNRQIMKYLGSDALAVYGIITQVTAFVQCLSYGIGQAAQPIVSQNYGAGRYGRIRECLKYGLLTSVGFGLFWAGVMMLGPNVLVHMFMEPTTQVLAIAPGIVRAYGISYLLLPFNLFATYYFQALMKAGISLVVSLARGAVICGICIVILPVLFGPDSLWYTMLVTEILVGGYSGYHMIRMTQALR